MIEQSKKKLLNMIEQLGSIIENAKKREKKEKKILAQIHPDYQKSVANLFHYRTLRQQDLTSLQRRLGYLGLSRLANAQVHVMASLQNVHAILKALAKNKPIKTAVPSALSFKQSRHKLNKNTKTLLGPRPKGRRTRIMVTMPTEAANNLQLVEDMLKAGMNCARVNCAHDSPEVWKQIIKNIRYASKKLKQPCKVAMDLAGPKIRTGTIKKGPKVLKLRPTKDILGRIENPLAIWISPDPLNGLPHIPIAKKDLDKLAHIDTLYFTDTRGKKRTFHLVKKAENGYYAHCPKTTFVRSGLKLFSDKKRKQYHITTIGELPAVGIPLLLKKGDLLRLNKELIEGENATYDKAGNLKSLAHISCTAPQIFEQVKIGERILFDDGKIEGIIEEVDKNELIIKIQQAKIGGSKLSTDKGLNLPDSQLTISGLTEKDRKDLPFVVEYADIINFSFVNRPKDVKELNKELKKLNALNKLGVVLKIETKTGYNQLTNILIEAMKVHPVGVMIARGDLAVESGWQSIGQVQEEILAVCRAAHISDIWATQVLEGLAKKRLPSRAEITDAVMSQRADCVMLNKGPYIVEAITLLDTIFKNMEIFWDKNKTFSPRMQRI